MASTSARACLTKLMSPTSANLMGNVHGGTILDLCERAGRIASARWSRGAVALVGAARTEFVAPVHVGEVATVDAKLDYVGRHVMRVSMTVEAEEMESGRRRLTNRASMWYSTIDICRNNAGANGTNSNCGQATTDMKVGSRILHPLHPSEVADDAAYHHRASMEAREKIPLHMRSESEFHIVLQELPGIDSVANHPFMSAGYILKLMDSGAALAAIAHSRHECVTVLLDKVCFHNPIRVGDLCTVRAGVTYTSNRSMEVVCQVWKSPSGIVGGLIDNLAAAPTCAVEARFVFVALGADGRAIPVPQIPIDERTGRWDLAAAKHDERVAERSARDG